MGIRMNAVWRQLSPSIQAAIWGLAALALTAVAACSPEPSGPTDHGAIAEGISAPLGQPGPWATAEQLKTFARGRAVAERRFSLADGLGPAFNVTFCGACHEKPNTGGSAGLYRNFFLTGRRFPDGAFVPGTSAGKSGGVIRMYDHAPGRPARPEVPATTNVIAQRNAIPFYGVGLLAELDGKEILKRADPNDKDGDGISGRPNWDRGFVGRFGRKAQTVSIEGFIRGPLFNHMGITTDPLSQEQKAALPVDSSNGSVSAVDPRLAPLRALRQVAQAAADDGPVTDDDGVPDPEMSTADLFDLVSFAMLLAAPQIGPESEVTARGRRIFDDLGCKACHTPRLRSKRGPLPVYSDLLLHDMGPELADGLVQGEASGSEFRTQPLWGIAAVGPYLHDGRADTLKSAVLWHGGEGQRARDKANKLSDAQWADLEAFLMSLGGRDQRSTGLIKPGTPVAEVGAWGGPRRKLSADEQAKFLAGRSIFDHEYGRSDGVGGPRLNGDSCRACHFEPVVGGAGPRGVNVMRHGLLDPDGRFVPPSVGTVLHKTTVLPHSANRPQKEAIIFEHRQTPHLFGLGLIDAISAKTILAGADPADSDGDGISGRPSYVDGGRLGRFGWKAQVPTLEEFVRDAVTTELGMTLPWAASLTFGRMHDNDGAPDPEFSDKDANSLDFYLAMLAAPPRTHGPDTALETKGEQVFNDVGCAACHTPELPSARGPVRLFSDLLLHDMLPKGAHGIEEAGASMREFRTAPLWGLAKTAPYLHDGSADTVDQAVRRHDGEALKVREAYVALPEKQRAALVAFLRSL